MQLDHLVVAGQTLEAAVEHSEAALGQSLRPGGRHESFGTYNQLLGFAGREYFEAIAIDPDGVDPGRPRWFGLDGFTGAPRLVTWVARVPDLAAAVALWPEAGEITEFQRGDLRWRMAVPRDGALAFGGVVPMLIEWQGELHPSRNLGEAGGQITALSLRTPEPQAVADLLARLGLSDPRIQIEAAPATSLRALIGTPQGSRVLA
jgi:hypothetical protein